MESWSWPIPMMKDDELLPWHVLCADLDHREQQILKGGREVSRSAARSGARNSVAASRLRGRVDIEIRRDPVAWERAVDAEEQRAYLAVRAGFVASAGEGLPGGASASTAQLIWKLYDAQTSDDFYANINKAWEEAYAAALGTIDKMFYDTKNFALLALLTTQHEPDKGTEEAMEEIKAYLQREIALPLVDRYRFRFNWSRSKTTRAGDYKAQVTTFWRIYTKALHIFFSKIERQLRARAAVEGADADADADAPTEVVLGSTVYRRARQMFEHDLRNVLSLAQKEVEFMRRMRQGPPIRTTTASDLFDLDSDDDDLETRIEAEMDTEVERRNPNLEGAFRQRSHPGQFAEKGDDGLEWSKWVLPSPPKKEKISTNATRFPKPKTYWEGESVEGMRVRQEHRRIYEKALRNLSYDHPQDKSGDHAAALVDAAFGPKGFFGEVESSARAVLITKTKMLVNGDLVFDNEIQDSVDNLFTDTVIAKRIRLGLRPLLWSTIVVTKGKTPTRVWMSTDATQAKRKLMMQPVNFNDIQAAIDQPRTPGDKQRDEDLLLQYGAMERLLQPAAKMKKFGEEVPVYGEFVFVAKGTEKKDAAMLDEAIVQMRRLSGPARTTRVHLLSKSVDRLRFIEHKLRLETGALDQYREQLDAVYTSLVG